MRMQCALVTSTVDALTLTDMFRPLWGRETSGHPAMCIVPTAFAKAEPEAERVQAFFDNLSERYIRDELLLVHDTTQEELAYIAAKAEEAALAKEAGSVGTMEDEADTAAEEKEFAEWAGSAGKPAVPAPGLPSLKTWSRRGERQQEEQLRATPNTPPPSTTPPRGLSLARASTAKPTRMEEGEASLGAGGSVPATNVGAEGTTSSQPDMDPLSTDQEDIDTVIEELAKDAVAEAARIAAGEAAKSATEEANNWSTGEADKAAAEEADKASAKEDAKKPAEEEVANDQPSSPAAPAPGKYLKVGDDLFIRLPWMASTRAPAEGEVFDDEALTTAGLQVVDEPSASGGSSQEEQLLRAMSANFQKLQALQRARQDKMNSRMAAVDKAEADFEEHVAHTQVWFGEAREELRTAQGELEERKRELILKQADIEKAQETAKEQAAKEEAARLQQQALLNTQEEDLVAREQALAATLCGKDEEIGKIVVQWTQELEQKHKYALDALALDHASKVEKLELELGQLKKEILTLTEERDTGNCTLADSQAAISDKAKLLFEANDSINNLKLKLDGLEGMLSEVTAREETLNKALETEMQLRSDDAAAHKEYVGIVNLWISRLVDVTGRLTAQLAIMGMPDVRYSQEPNMSPNARPTLFFERILNALEQLRSNRVAYLANESRRLCRGALTKVLTKVAF
nr:uncharacterized protein LOC109746002 [Aegilops tauschii subsp. strangulata]